MPFDFLKRHADKLLKQQGLCITATWGEKTLTGTRSSVKRSDAFAMSGEQIHYDISLLVPSSEIETAGSCPKPLKDVLVIDGESHLVISVETDVAGNRRLNLGSRYG